jgi:hypothetical protein
MIELRGQVERMARDRTLAGGDRSLPGPARAPAENDRLEVVAVLIDLGFDVNEVNRTASLHEAATRGNLR